MKMNRLFSLALVALTSVSLAFAEEEPIQLSLWAPAPQLEPAESSIYGFRLAVFGRNDDVTGVDLGFGAETLGEFKGFSLHVVYNYVGEDSTGYSMSMINLVSGSGYGVHGGVATLIENDHVGLCGGVYSDVQGCMTGVQFGFVNRCTELYGVQFGFVNMAHTGTGLQIGLVNIFDVGFSPIFPILNFHF